MFHKNIENKGHSLIKIRMRECPLFSIKIKYTKMFASIQNSMQVCGKSMQCLRNLFTSMQKCLQCLCYM
jgi:hypothetical protein